MFGLHHKDWKQGGTPGSVQSLKKIHLQTSIKLTNEHIILHLFNLYTRRNVKATICGFTGSCVLEVFLEKQQYICAVSPAVAWLPDRSVSTGKLHVTVNGCCSPRNTSSM